MLSDADEFITAIVAISGLIFWNIIKFWKAKAKNAEAKLSEKRIDEIFQAEKRKVMDGSLSDAIDLGNDFVSKHSSDYGNKKE